MTKQKVTKFEPDDSKKAQGSHDIPLRDQLLHQITDKTALKNSFFEEL